ncbi:Wzy polymerase domain-containing protein [Enterobacter cloacae complex sp. ESBL7]|uniref:PglL family O-oligosaccharyltransferase n=1 Tax=Enterobacter cloacae complex sp. ESBL7 TaxID=3163325 RepID=UPI003564325A
MNNVEMQVTETGVFPERHSHVMTPGYVLADRLVAWGACLMLAIHMLFLMHVNLAHSPGTGMSLPQNILLWGLVGLMVLLASCRPLRVFGWRNESFMLTLLTGLVLLSLPWLYSPVTWRYLADMRMAGLAGGVLLMFACRSLFLTQAARNHALILLMLGCVVEAVLCLVQLIFPDVSLAGVAGVTKENRVGGIFFQPNVMASFLVTGLALACHLTVTGRSRLALAGLLPATLLMAACLPLTQSITGWVCLAVLVVAMVLSALKFSRRYALMWLLTAVIGVGLGMGLYHHLHGAMVDHSGSRFSRKAILMNTLWLIGQRPLAGWGYGHFEMAYITASQSTGNRGLESTVLVHPHNELLYWISEGGVVAGLGVLLILVAGGLLLWRAWRQAADAGGYGAPGSEAYGLMCCAFPVLIHTQLEYPIYLSSLHYAIVLMLLAFADIALKHQAQAAAGTTTSGRTRVTLFSLRLLMFCSALCIVAWMVTAMGVGMQLTLAETQGVSPARMQALHNARAWNPWVMSERAWRVEAVAQAVRAQQTGDMSLLLPVIGWEEQYLRRHADPDFTAMLISHLRATGQSRKAEEVLSGAAKTFPRDARFSPTDAPVGATGPGVAGAVQMNSQ